MGKGRDGKGGYDGLIYEVVEVSRALERAVTMVRQHGSGGASPTSTKMRRRTVETSMKVHRGILPFCVAWKASN